MLVNGAISTLINSEFWSERDGGQTIADTIEAFTEMWLDYIGEYDDMIGAVIPMITDVLPPYMLWADGDTYQRADYPDLYGRLPSAFIINADSFFVPDLRGRTVIGSGQGSGLTDRPLGVSGGEEEHQLTVGELASHRHGLYADVIFPASNSVDPPTLLSESIVTLKETADAGGDEAHNNMQPFLALRFAIVAKSRDAC